jgi:predicted transposase YdaD
MTGKNQEIEENVTSRLEAERRKYDSAWKKVIKKLFRDFLEFFFIDIHNAIDFTKEILFLDKELKEIDPDSSQGDRVADVLAKVHLKDGRKGYLYIVIHIEVQGEPQANFMERMFIYYYRTFDKEKKEKVPVISVAILTDDNKKYRPGEYRVNLFGFDLRMKIPIVKIIDYKLKKELMEKLETSDNPMALVVNAQLKSHEVKGADNSRKFEVTKELIRQCYKHGYSRDKTRTILNFFDWSIRLPEVYKDRIKEVIIKTEEEYKMEYVPIWERDILNEGVKKGVEKGVKKGVKKGADEEKIRTARMMLKKGFDIDTIVDITGLNKKKLEKLTSNYH